MLLCDTSIISLAHRGMVEPFDPKYVQPASIDVHLGKDLMIENEGPSTIDPRYDSEFYFGDYEMDGLGYEAAPGELILGSTIEKITLPAGVAARFEGKSSLGRLGLMTHVTAGFIDPGFSGEITVEISKVGRRPFRLIPGMKIGQICFYNMDAEPEALYGSKIAGSHYQGQTGPQVSRIHERFAVREF